MKNVFSSLTILQRIFLVVSVLLIAGWFALDGLLGMLEERFQRPFFVSLILIIGISGLTAFFIAVISVRHMARPLKQFIEGAREIGRGNFDHKIHIEGHEEIIQLARIFNYMTLELKRIHQININQIIRERIKTEAVLRNIADGVIVTGPYGDTRLINQVVERWLNITEKNVIGSSINFFLPELKLLIDRTIVSNEPEILTEEIEITDQQTHEPVILGANAASVMDDHELIAVVVVLRNITKEKAIDRLKTELVSVVAHELRSPLTSIAGFSEVLKDPDLPESTRKEYTDIIHYESGRLAEMINKFLDISRIESGQTVMNKMSVEVHTIVSSALNMNLHLFEKKQIKVHTEFSAEPILVHADPNLMGQVMINLLSNAIKYSPPDSRVDVRVERKYGQAMITVADCGYGISPDNLKHIFKKFFRAKDDKRIKEIEGTGLGLAFVKEIMHQHNGQILIESELGKGTICTLVMDIEENEQNQ